MNDESRHFKLDYLRPWGLGRWRSNAFVVLRSEDGDYTVHRLMAYTYRNAQPSAHILDIFETLREADADVGMREARRRQIHVPFGGRGG